MSATIGGSAGPAIIRDVAAGLVSFTPPADGMDGRWAPYPALAAEPVAHHRMAADGTIEPYGAIVHEPMVPVTDVRRRAKYVHDNFSAAQTESFRGLVERVSARLHEETRRDVMAGLARAGRRHRGAIL